MYVDSNCAAASNGLLVNKVAMRDGEAELAATLRRTLGEADGVRPARVRTAASTSGSERVLGRSVTSEIVRTVEARLPGRIHGLRIDVEEDRYTLRGISSSYYVKQVAGHLAMTALDAQVLGRLVNEIEVRSVR